MNTKDYYQIRALNVSPHSSINLLRLEDQGTNPRDSRNPCETVMDVHLVSLSPQSNDTWWWLYFFSSSVCFILYSLFCYGQGMQVSEVVTCIADLFIWNQFTPLLIRKVSCTWPSTTSITGTTIAYGIHCAKSHYPPGNHHAIHL